MNHFITSTVAVLALLFCAATVQPQQSSFPSSKMSNGPLHGKQNKDAYSDHCNSLLSKENPLETEYLSSADRSDLEFCRVTDTMETVEMRLSFRDTKYNFWKSFRRETVPLWLDLRDVYCEFHPAAPYVDFFGNVERCPNDAPPIHTDRVELEKLFSENETGSFNAEMFVQEQSCNGDKDCLQKQEDALRPLVKSSDNKN